MSVRPAIIVPADVAAGFQVAPPSAEEARRPLTSASVSVPSGIATPATIVAGSPTLMRVQLLPASVLR
jgi:hypothetical protein